MRCPHRTTYYYSTLKKPCKLGRVFSHLSSQTCGTCEYSETNTEIQCGFNIIHKNVCRSLIEVSADQDRFILPRAAAVLPRRRTTGARVSFRPAIGLFSHIFACCSLNFHSLSLCFLHTITTSHSDGTTGRILRNKLTKHAYCPLRGALQDNYPSK